MRALHRNGFVAGAVLVWALAFAGAATAQQLPVIDVVIGNNFGHLKGQLPPLDMGLATLVEDLDAHGMLKDTIVIVWGEFGRTPRVNADAGRDHYPNVFSAALAGGPVRGGRVVGESDARGAFPRANPKTPQDVLATLYRHLGVDTTEHYQNATGRPIPVLPSGTVIEELC